MGTEREDILDFLKAYLSSTQEPLPDQVDASYQGFVSEQVERVKVFLSSCGADRAVGEAFTDAMVTALTVLLNRPANEFSSLRLPVLQRHLTAPEQNRIRQYPGLALAAFFSTYRKFFGNGVPNFLHKENIEAGSNAHIARQAQSVFENISDGVRVRIMIADAAEYSGASAGADVVRRKTDELSTTSEAVLRAAQDETAKIKDATTRTADINQMQTEFLSSAKKQFDEYINKIDAKLQQVTIERQLRDSVQLWAHKATEHYRGFAVSAGFMLLLIIATIAIIARYPEMVEAVFVHVADKSAIAAGVLVSAPFVVAFAFIRLVSRYATTSLALRDDARQRQALVDTLVFLAGDQNQKMNDDLRRIAVEGIFRAAPGQVADDSSISQILEAIKR